MPHRPPRTVRANQIDHPSHAAVSTLLISACPGPPLCRAVHTYLFVDGLDLITRSVNGAAGASPRQLLRPGGPLYPTDQEHTADVADTDSTNGSLSVNILVGLRGQTVIWSNLMYPGRDSQVVEEVRFELGQYIGEIERAYSQWGQEKTPTQTQRPCPSRAPRSGGGRQTTAKHGRADPAEERPQIG
jgi:hypothetical protein